MVSWKTKGLIYLIAQTEPHCALPPCRVQISRHRRYELEAEIVVGDETLYHIPRDEWRRIRLPHCPNADLQIVNSVFPVSEFPKE